MNRPQQTMNSARLIIDKQCGPMNMAVDEALLLSAPQSGPTLRFYQWDEPTLSLGYFQGVADRSQHAASAGCPIVRRSTGGGAILHHHELTYSFALPLNQQDKSASQPLYYAFHETLVQALATLHVEASLFAEQPIQKTSHLEPFLCFQRRTAGDVVVAEAKVCGSAQRRQKESLLQHGSVLLGSSPFAPELPGINDLGEARLSAEILTAAWLPLLETRLKLHFQPNCLSQPERSSSERLAEDRFGADSWSARR